jgi:hypothetical protein
MTNFDYFDEEMFDIAHRIERFGFTTMSVNTGECSVPGCSSPEHSGPTWTYSIGMLEHEHPEIVIVGAPLALAYELIDAAFEWHHAGLSLPFGRHGRLTTVGATFTTVPVPHLCWTESDLMAYWHNYYRTVGWPEIECVDDPVVQLVIADEQGLFPWDEGCEAALVERQPIIEDDDSAWPRWNRAARRSSHRSKRRRGRR